jgi:hypothetical protein
MPAEERNLGYNTRTPDTCPLRAAVIAAALRPLGFISIGAMKEAAKGLDRESANWLRQVIDDA